jgi:hypothetical protein
MSEIKKKNQNQQEYKSQEKETRKINNVQVTQIEQRDSLKLLKSRRQ